MTKIALIAFVSAQETVSGIIVSRRGYRVIGSEFLKEHTMSDHVTPDSAFFSAEEKVQIRSGKCPGITKGRLKVWLSFRKGTARDGSASSDGTKADCLDGVN